MKAGLNTAKSYIVSYWSSSGAASVNGVTASAGPVKNGWQYFEHLLPSPVSTVTVSGNVIIDELRLYPAQAQMTTYTFDPFFGVTAICSPNNIVEYYEYDNSGRLSVIRDDNRNVKKTAGYFYTGFFADTAVWRSSGGNNRVKPCPAAPSYFTNIRQYEQIDINPNSPTYRSLRWADGETILPGQLDISAWQNTATAIRCKTSGGNNTGEQEQEQIDVNPCSPAYNQTRWIVIGTNLSACPLPCTGVNQKIVNGVCETGVKKYTASVFNSSTGKYSCKYHYEFSDCSKTIDYFEDSTTACTLGTPCTPP